MHKIFAKLKLLDLKITQYFNSRFSFATSRFVDLITLNPAIVYVAIFIYDYFILSHKYAFSIIMCVLFGIFVMIFKNIVHRSRPVVSTKNTFQELMEFKTDKYSFPSAHTFAYFVITPLFFLMFDFLFGILFTLYSVLIGFSRVYLGKHYVTDVVASVILGFACGMLVLV